MTNVTNVTDGLHNITSVAANVTFMLEGFVQYDITKRMRTYSAPTKSELRKILIGRGRRTDDAHRKRSGPAVAQQLRAH